MKHCSRKILFREAVLDFLIGPKGTAKSTSGVMDICKACKQSKKYKGCPDDCEHLK